MTETVDALDPKRPWITDPRDLPAKQNWFGTFLNPFGTSPKVHFTRAWTVLFMARVITMAFVIGVTMVAGMTGGDAGALMVLIPVVFALTIPTSLIAHIRRLADAGKPAVLAGLVFLPVILAFAAFIAVAGMASAEHDRMMAEAERPETTEAPAEAREEGQGERGGRRGGRDGPPPEKAEFVMQRAGAPAGLVWALTSLFVMLWSLMWVARKPSKEPEPDRQDYETA
ncbi:MAG: DUF805 domain-containing protein [Pseudomonadota bacterium]